VRAGRRVAAVAVVALAAAAMVSGTSRVSVSDSPARCGRDARSGIATPGARHSWPAPSDDDHACRFWGMITSAPQDSLVTEHLVSGAASLMSLSGDNPDGWSVAYHSPALEAAGLPRSQILRGWPRADHATDARYTEAVAEIVSMGASCGMAHIRDASPGSHVGIPNPHFFGREGVTFGHNGGVSESDLVTLLQEGSPDYLETHPPDYEDPYLDSELLFMYVLKIREEGPPASVDSGHPEMPAHGGRGKAGTSLRRALIEGVLEAFEADAIETAANCIVTTGDSIMAVRFDINDQKKYRVRYLEIDTGWVVSSEPVGSDTSGWLVLPPKSIGVFKAGAPPVITQIYPPAWPDLVVAGQLVDDDTAGGSSGDSDGGCDAGETVELIVTLRNDGGEDALGVTATLSTDDEHCTVTDAEEEYGDIATGAQAQCQEDFDIVVDPSCPDGHEALFSLAVESAGRELWQLDFTLAVGAPDLSLYGYLLDDTAHGNSDRHVQPGETFELTPVLLNNGGEEATGLHLSLSVAHPEASLLQGAASLDSISAGGKESSYPPFELSVGAAAGDPDVLVPEVDVVADWGRTARLQLLIPVGGFWDEMEAGEGSWTTYAVTGGFANQWHLSTQRNYTSGRASSWKCGSTGSGDYTDLLDAALESEPVTLRLRSFLRFRHWMAAEESGSNPGRCYDGGMVELSVDGGTWAQIHPVGGYTHATLDGAVQGPWPAGTEVFSGAIDWAEALFEVNGLSGTGRFRFRFGSDGAYAGEGWYVDNVEFFGTDDLSTGAVSHPEDAASSLQLRCVSPARFPCAMVYDLPREAGVEINVYDASGRLVRSLREGTRPAGRHTAEWDGRDTGGAEVASGVYFARLEVGDQTALGRLVVLR